MKSQPIKGVTATLPDDVYDRIIELVRGRAVSRCSKLSETGIFSVLIYAAVDLALAEVDSGSLDGPMINAIDHAFASYRKRGKGKPRPAMPKSGLVRIMPEPVPNYDQERDAALRKEWNAELNTITAERVARMNAKLAQVDAAQTAGKITAEQRRAVRSAIISDDQYRTPGGYFTEEEFQAWKAARTNSGI